MKKDHRVGEVKESGASLAEALMAQSAHTTASLPNNKNSKENIAPKQNTKTNQHGTLRPISGAITPDIIGLIFYNGVSTKQYYYR